METKRQLYSGFIWALFTLGITEMSLVLLPPWYFILLALMCAFLLILNTIYLEEGKNSSTKISRSLLTCSGGLLILKTIYLYTTQLEVSLEIIALNFVGLVAFLIGGFISGIAFLKFKNGSN